jgi:hypothetical protein
MPLARPKLVPSIALVLVVGCGSDVPVDLADGAVVDGSIVPHEDGGDAALPVIDGGSAGPTCRPVSGSRLRVRMLETSGVTVPLGLYDRELGTACAPGGPEGGTRCVPSPSATGLVYFTDAACTARLLLPDPSPGEPAPTFYTEQDIAPDGCVTGYRFSRLTGSVELAGGETIYFVGGDGSCQATTASAGTYQTLGLSLDLAHFVPLERREVPGSGTRIGLDAWEGADGSRWCRAALVDRELDADCGIGVAADGELRCVPYGVGYHSRVFTDASCSSPVAVVTTSPLCDSPAPTEGWAWSYDPGVHCIPRVVVTELGAPLTPPLYEGGPAACAETPVVPGEQILAAVATEPSRFAAITRQEIATPGRLLLSHDVIESGPTLEPAIFVDPGLGGATCAFERAGDAMLRCVPVESEEEVVARIVTRYTDPECASPIELGATFAPCADAPPRYATSDDGRPLRVHAIGGVYTGPLYDSTDECFPIDPSASYFTIGAAVVPESMIGGTTLVE